MHVEVIIGEPAVIVVKGVVVGGVEVLVGQTVVLVLVLLGRVLAEDCPKEPTPDPGLWISVPIPPSPPSILSCNIGRLLVLCRCKVRPSHCSHFSGSKSLQKNLN